MSKITREEEIKPTDPLYNSFKIGDKVPYLNTSANMCWAEISSFKDTEHGRNRIWFIGVDTKTNAHVYYPVKTSNNYLSAMREYARERERIAAIGFAEWAMDETVIDNLSNKYYALEDFTTGFYYWWHNQKGNSTKEAFIDWIETKEGNEKLKALCKHFAKSEGGGLDEVIKEMEETIAYSDKMYQSAIKQRNEAQQEIERLTAALARSEGERREVLCHKFYVVEDYDHKFHVWSKFEYERYVNQAVGHGAGSAYKLIIGFNGNENYLFPEKPNQGVNDERSVATKDKSGNKS